MDGANPYFGLVTLYIDMVVQFIRSLFMTEYYYDDMLRYIEVEEQSASCVCRRGVAIIDKHCEHDTVSRAFAERLGYSIIPDTGITISTTIMGENVQCLAKVRLRWHCEEKNIPRNHRLYFDRKFRESTFFVTNAKDDFDIIIGSRTIERLECSRGRRRLIATFFHPQETFDSTEVSSEQAKADARRKKELEEMQRDHDKKKKEKTKTKVQVS